MLENIEPLSTGNGLVGKYKGRTSDIYFSMLIADGTKTTLDNISAANEQIANLRRLDNTGDKFSSMSSSFRKNGQEPKRFRLDDNQFLEASLTTALNEGEDTIFICQGRSAYIRACSRLGITRADHLACAEMHALLTEEYDGEKYVAGSAHKIRDALIKVRKKYSKLIGTNFEYLRGTTEELIRDIPEASKFQLGLADFSNFSKTSDNEPWLYKLPFNKCVFEVDMPYDNDPQKGIQKTFIVAKEKEDGLYEGHILYWDYKNELGTHDFYILWDTTGEKTKYAIMGYRPTFMATEEFTQHLGTGYFWALMPFLAEINDPQNRILKIKPPTYRRLGATKDASPFYDYHVIEPNRTQYLHDSFATADAEPYRLHSRRGHYRTYQHERFTNLRGQIHWIEPKIWGDETKGVLGKEYDLSGGQS